MPLINRRAISTTGLDQDGLATTRAHDVVQNFASLTTSGDVADGIYGAAAGITVENFSCIATTGAGAAGIFIVGNDAHLANQGSVVTSGDVFDLDGVTSTTGDDLAADGIRILGNRFQMSNSGDVSVSGFAASGLFALGSGGTVSNSGQISTIGDLSNGIVAVGDSNSIRNDGAIQADGFLAAGIYADGDRNIGANYGTIIVSGDLSAGMFFGGPASHDFLGSSGHVLNAGEIDVQSGQNGWGMIVVGNGDILVNSGTVHLESGFVGFAIQVEGSNNQALNSGTVRALGPGVRGVFIQDDSELTNSGAITVDGDLSKGVHAYGSDVNIINTGSIQADGVNAIGIEIGFSTLQDIASDSRIENSGDITVGSGAFAAVAMFGLNLQLNNSGTISAPALAIVGGDSTQQVQNSGEIVGNVGLGNGDDVYVAERGGRLDGILFLGAGDDLVVLENGSGTTVIGDFEAASASHDTIDVSAFGFRNLADLLAAAQQNGSDIAITLDRDDQVVLKGVALSDLQANDFLFALHGTAATIPGHSEALFLV